MFPHNPLFMSFLAIAAVVMLSTMLSILTSPWF